ncbi:MAG: hypothetical protein ABJN84_03600 [Flavobacteriaceae bacterium]
MKRFLFFFLVLISCDSGSENSNNLSSDETKIDLVTGIILKQSISGPSILLGNPNTFDDNLLIFPNPPIDAIFVEQTENLPISEIWIVPAVEEKLFQSVDFSTILNSELYTDVMLDSSSQIKIDNLQSSNITIDLSNLSTGYYRLFVKVEGGLFWSNIYLNRDGIAIEELTDFWN